ncbi:MAG: class A beta-lactamase-related serine hydrolase [Firmicutes bacterium]|nr:class A beta-lactamase-related serine hydrolase [Bacillota bacterium]MDD7601424.1 class A beta-lactamase-related serine hydrolase [Bacillota bacterium]MDY5856116.1 serine hydrolase [Anaerovoracaceae bacterium]
MIMTAMTDRLANVEGKIGVAYIDLSTGQRLFCGNTKVFPASGMVMLMALTECFRAMEEGRIRKDQTYRLDLNSVKIETRASFGVLNHLHDGIELTVEDLYTLMITVSDNLAFNILTDLLGMDRINETFRSLGYSNMRINRKIYDLEKMAMGVENTVSVEEIASIFERIYRGQLVSRSASRSMLELLELHQQHNILPHPFSETMRIAHQTGVDEDVLLDAGIVSAQNPFVLSLAASDMDMGMAETVLRDITQICYLETREEHQADIEKAYRSLQGL